MVRPGRNSGPHVRQPGEVGLCERIDGDVTDREPVDHRLRPARLLGALANRSIERRDALRGAQAGVIREGVLVEVLADAAHDEMPMGVSGRVERLDKRRPAFRLGKMGCIKRIAYRPEFLLEPEVVSDVPKGLRRNRHTGHVEMRVRIEDGQSGDSLAPLAAFHLSSPPRLRGHRCAAALRRAAAPADRGHSYSSVGNSVIRRFVQP